MTKKDPMKRLLLLALTTGTLLMGTAASAHCDQKHEHQGTGIQQGTRN
jgi:hypothetical protein